MTTGAIRRGQLVTPFGVGAMSVLVDGTSVITAGLDHWFDTQNYADLALEEYEVHDWRLKERLKVSSFRLPPDYRHSPHGHDKRNVGLVVPVLRFPRWCFCMYCKRLSQSKLTARVALECTDPEHRDWKTKPRMSQVPFVVICARGHLDDFPFDKWLHRVNSPACPGPLRLVSRGGEGLEGQVVTCDACGKERALRGITEAHVGKDGIEHTNLSDHLLKSDDLYLCRGAKPWLAQTDEGCGEPLRGALRAAGNVYFPKIESSIYIPHQEGVMSEEMHSLLKHPAVSATFATFASLEAGDPTGPQLRKLVARTLRDGRLETISDEELVAAYYERVGPRAVAGGPAEPPGDGEQLSSDVAWRYPEYLKIRETPKDTFLAASDPGVDPSLASYLGRVRSVDVLRETRVLRGFTRVRDSDLKLSEGKRLLRRRASDSNEDWLPAYVVKGEGIYFELEPSRLATWEARSIVQERANRLGGLYRAAAEQQLLRARQITPRLVLLHTLAHLLINELTLACGYSSASLRERLYVSASDDRAMAGVLIYTAAGDSEGTLGGLVRMASPSRLAQVFRGAISSAHWCSTDPVCMDVGEKGQGPDSCNLAACHSCALLPETSCEEFNRLLDRGLVVGTLADRSLGFFGDQE